MEGGHQPSAPVETMAMETNNPGSQDPAGALESCLSFLKGNTDEQRLVGLLLATKYVQGDDRESILKVFDAIGIQFFNRLFKSGIEVTSHGTKVQDQPYLQLALSVLSAFCRMPELACLDDIIDKVPALIQILKTKPVDTIVMECLESLLGIGTASEKGLVSLMKHGDFYVAIQFLANSCSTDTALSQLSAKITMLLLGGSVPEEDIVESADNISSTISVLAERLLASNQGVSKLDALPLLRMLCSQKILVHIGKEKVIKSAWLESLRTCIGYVLQSRVVAEPKFMVLELVESIVEICGGNWLLGPICLRGEGQVAPSDRFFILLVENLRIETVVLLNEIARYRFDPEYASLVKLEESRRRKHNLATCYALLETVMDVIVEETDETRLCDMTLKQTISVLNETMSTVIDFLQEAKKKNLTKGDEFLASARVIGRYLTDAPPSQKKLRTQFLSLLQYLFGTTSDSVESPSMVVQLLLPALCQVTLEKEGCEALVSFGGHKEVIQFLVMSIQENQGPSPVILKAFDVILNLLQKENRLENVYMPSDFIRLITVLPDWAVKTQQVLEMSLAACVCVMVLDLSNEASMLEMTSTKALSTIYELIIRVLGEAEKSEALVEPTDQDDLWDLTFATSTDFMDRYPGLKCAIKSSTWFQRLFQDRNLWEMTVGNNMRSPALHGLMISLLDD